MNPLRILLLVLWTTVGSIYTPQSRAETLEAASVEQMLVYFGTYTQGDSEGIYVYELNLNNGSLTKRHTVAGVDNPSFLAIHPDKTFLYAVNEVAEFQGQPGGGVTAFRIEADGNLTKLNERASQGAAPCHLIVDHTGSHVLAANYTGGSVIVLPIQQDGSLGKQSSFIQHLGKGTTPRQSSPHAHSINLSNDNRFAFAADLGLDKVLIYRFDADQGTLTPNQPGFAKLEPASGPRHFSVHPNGEFAYVINEMNLTVTAFQLNQKTGALTTLQTLSTLPPGESKQPGQSTAEVQVSPSGRFLYGSNRGHNTIVAYRINESTGLLTYLENQSTGGGVPRNFGIDPTERFLLAENQKDNTVVVLRIDSETGMLSPAGTTADVPTPVCAKFLPVLRSRSDLP
ncbi:MAG: lactonase family protein [Rubripirellula sp.]